MTKFTWAFIIVSLTSLNMYSQSTNQISAHYGLIGSELIKGTTLEGSDGFSNRNSYQIGFKYARQISSKIAIETGVNLISANVEISSEDPLFETKNEKLDLISIPVLAKHSFEYRSNS